MKTYIGSISFVEFTTQDVEAKETVVRLARWKQYTDRASNERSSRIGVILVTLEEWTICYALKLEFLATNNEVEYKALIWNSRQQKN